MVFGLVCLVVLAFGAGYPTATNSADSKVRTCVRACASVDAIEHSN